MSGAGITGALAVFLANPSPDGLRCHQCRTLIRFKPEMGVSFCPRCDVGYGYRLEVPRR